VAAGAGRTAEAATEHLLSGLDHRRPPPLCGWGHWRARDPPRVRHDPASQALHAAALRLTAGYLQVDWWDQSEGPLPNPEITYPQLKRAAAFACTQSTCSNPVYEPDAIAATVTAALYQ